MSEAAGDRYFRSWALMGLGVAAWDMEDTVQAQTLAAETIRLSRKVGNHVSVANGVEVTAWVCSATGKPELGARLIGGVQTLWATIKASLYPHLVSRHESVIASLRESLGEKRYQELVESGSRLGTEDLVRLALGEEAVATEPRRTRSATQLTRREEEVARLVAEGVSNKEIASRLFIASRTAETHVDHILTKLGFTSRVQIAAWVMENRSTTSPSE
jgi:non-specific serine/threonine protein kinase